MAVRRIRGSWWVDIRHNFIRYRKRSPLNTRAGAAAYEVVLRNRLSRGEDINVAPPATDTPPAPRFAAFVRDWIETYAKTNNKLSEYATKRTVAELHLIPFFGNAELTEIRRDAVERYKSEKRRAGLAAKTVNNHLIVLGTCLRYAEECEAIERAPVIRSLPTPPPPFVFLTRDELDRLLASPPEPAWILMVRLAARTGMRLGELLALHWEDVDLDRGLITVRRSAERYTISTTKNYRVRHIPMTSDLRKEFERARAGDGLVFPTAAGGLRQRSAAGNALARACERAGIRRIGWHALRHTFASHLVIRDVPLRVVQELMGHSEITMTMRYSHLSPSSLRVAIDALEQSVTPERRGQPVGNIVNLNPEFPVQFSMPHGDFSAPRTAKSLAQSEAF